MQDSSVVLWRGTQGAMGRAYWDVLVCLASEISKE